MNGKAQKIETHPLKSLGEMWFDRGGKWFFQKKKSVTKKGIMRKDEKRI